MPNPLTLKGLLLITCLTILLLQKQEHIVYISTFLIFFSIHLRYFSTSSNALIIALILMLLIKFIVEHRSVISWKAIHSNPVFLPILTILLVYIYSFLTVTVRNTSGLEYHLSMFITMICVLTFTLLLIGFITKTKRLKGILTVLMLLLLSNLIYSLSVFAFPGLGEFSQILGLSTSGSLMVGTGIDEALRLGGLTFFWEAYAEFLMMTVVFLTPLIINLKLMPKHRFFLIAVFLVSIIELLLTNTRGAIVLACLGGAIALIFVAELELMKKIKVLVIAIMIIFTAMFIASLSGKVKLYERFSDFTEIEHTRYGNLPKERAMVWVATLDHIVDNKFAGVGPSFYPLTRYPGANGHLEWPHNIILLIVATVGIPGLICYTFLLLRFIGLHKYIKKIKNSDIKTIYFGLWIALIVFFVEQMKFDGILRTPKPYVYFIWVLIALMFSAHNISKVEEDGMYERS